MATSRRTFLSGACGAGLVGLSLRAAPPAPPSAPPLTIVFVELKGGNDGLQMVCPAADPLYRRLRGDLALAAGELSAFDRGLSLHPGFAPLRPAVDRGELCVVGDVGYASPNRSHFRAIQIWDHASRADEVKDAGWLTRVLGARTADLGGVIVRGDDGPLEGARTLHVAGAARARGKARPATSPTAVSLSAAARHIEETRRAHQSLSAALAARLAAVKTPSAPPLAPKLEGAVDLAARVAIVAATGAPVAPVVKLTLPGFDTHTRQRATQDRLLGELGEGLASLRARLVEAGAWSRTVVVVMSEFGRRVAPNDNGGTDHGAAGPVLVCGGDARGGLVGAPPRLDDLADGDLRVRVEHRDVFASIARRALGTADDVLARELSSTARLPLFRA